MIGFLLQVNKPVECCCLVMLLLLTFAAVAAAAVAAATGLLSYVVSPFEFLIQRLYHCEQQRPTRIP